MQPDMSSEGDVESARSTTTTPTNVRNREMMMIPIVHTRRSATPASSILLFRTLCGAACACGQTKRVPHMQLGPNQRVPHETPFSQVMDIISSKAVHGVQQTNENHHHVHIGMCIGDILPILKNFPDRMPVEQVPWMDGQHKRQLQGVDHGALASRFHSPALHPLGCRGPW
jgi:hypothetical protein